jgi:hypothetical protein
MYEPVFSDRFFQGFYPDEEDLLPVFPCDDVDREGRGYDPDCGISMVMKEPACCVRGGPAGGIIRDVRHVSPLCPDECSDSDAICGDP